MNKLITIMLAALTAVFVGCDPKLPTPDKMEATSKAVGVAAGMVANQFKIDADVRAAIKEVMQKVAEVTPAADQSFTDAWTPVADEVIAKLVADGKLTEDQAVIAKTAFQVATKGIDYVFDVKYPKAKEVKELVDAAIRGFTDGFLSVFSDTMKAAPVDYDKEAYKYLTK